MSPVNGSSTLFLDFDGVICDSLEECYRSSWLALTGADLDLETLPEPPTDPAYRAVFKACRPFIRSGEDYLVVHEWAAKGRVPNSQQEFDASLAVKGLETMAGLKGNLYNVRDNLLSVHRNRWLGWNPLYPGMAEALAGQVQNPNVVILSTKKAEFIVEILGYHNVPWPLDRTLYTGPRRKLDIISELSPGTESWLIDDQIDHLDFDNPYCRCILALWGYVTPGAGHLAARSFNLTTAVEWISSFPRGVHQAG